MKTATLLVALLVAAALAHQADGRDTKKSAATIRVAHDAESFVTEISIRARDDRIAWSDVLRGLARARGYDDTALEGVLPDRRFDLTSFGSWAARAGLNRALRPHVRFDVKYADNPAGEPWLVTTLDRAALLASQRRFTAQLRGALLPRSSSDATRRYGLSLDKGWNRAAAGKNLVVFIHGLNSSPEHGKNLLAAARKEGFPCGSFRYPNDQPITDSARLLAGELTALAERCPDRSVSLVTHSMGGLVARAVIEDPRLDPGNVQRLIMVSPPNHGSALARFGFGLDLVEHVTDSVRQKSIRAMYTLIEDGLSEAAVDLAPGSQFLRKLNGGRRNPAVQYSIFLGNKAPMNNAELALLRGSVAEAGERNRWVRLFGDRVTRWLEDLDEVVDGKGDGAVALERGRLEGVEDTVVLGFGHTEALRDPGDGDVKTLHQEVLKRLKQER